MNFLRKISVRISVLYNRSLRGRYGFLGKNVFIVQPLQINGYSNIYIQDNVKVHYKTWLAALPLTGQTSCRLEIGQGSIIGNFNHIYATYRIIIGKNVLTADKVYISDNLHAYENTDVPVMHQPIRQIAPVSIGEGSWLGENVCIMGAKIGRNCVIGANSVVTKDIPDYCVAVGAPARIIKRYSEATMRWEATDAQGNFI